MQRTLKEAVERNVGRKLSEFEYEVLMIESKNQDPSIGKIAKAYETSKDYAVMAKRLKMSEPKNARKEAKRIIKDIGDNIWLLLLDVDEWISLPQKKILGRVICLLGQRRKIKVSEVRKAIEKMPKNYEDYAKNWLLGQKPKQGHFEKRGKEELMKREVLNTLLYLLKE